MSVRKHHATAPDGVSLIEVRNPAGSVTIEAIEDSDLLDIRVEALDDAAEQLLDRVEIDITPADPDSVGPARVRVLVPEQRLRRTPSFAITVRTPPGPDARVQVASAETELRGRLGRVVLTGASGDLAVEDCTELQVRTASGDVRVGSIAGSVTVGAASGDVLLDAVGGAVQVRTASGNVTVHQPRGDVSVATASGDVTVGRIGAGAARLKTVSGDASVGVAAGLRVWLDLQSVSGRMESQLADDATTDGPAQVSLTMRSVSGDLRIHPVTPAPAG